MADVRTRNQSAWLLPNDGTRTNHRLRQDMRRFADEDDLDLVIVGCGPAVRCCCSGLPGPAGGWQLSTRARSGIPTPTG